MEEWRVAEELLVVQMKWRRALLKECDAECAEQRGAEQQLAYKGTHRGDGGLQL